MAPRANQPTYDFLAGEHQDQGQPLRETITKQSLASRPARDVMEAEEVRVKLRTLQYELDTIKQERELHHLQHQQELREAQSRAEADFKRAQAAELAANVATKKAEALSRNTQEERDRQANEKLQLVRSPLPACSLACLRSIVGAKGALPARRQPRAARRSRGGKGRPRRRWT